MLFKPLLLVLAVLSVVELLAVRPVAELLPVLALLSPVLSSVLLLSPAALAALLISAESAAVVWFIRLDKTLCNWSLEVPKLLFNRFEVTRYLLMVVV
ncbi:MAG: hypothetical protein ABSC17_04195 [Thermacetogeniaceae bacterium]